MEKRNSSTILIEVLLKAIDKMGIKKTIQVLEISHNYSDDNKQLIQLVILNTCTHFGITQSTLLKGRKNIADRTNAIGVCALLLMRMCRLSQREISDILKKDPTLINKYIHKYQSLDKNFKDDIEVMRKMDLIELESIKQQSELNK
jgi:hypothetical protein